MTEAEARALPIGAAVKDNGPGIGTIVEKRLDSCSIKWTAPSTRVEGVSTFLFEDMKLISPGGAASGINFFGSTVPGTPDAGDAGPYTLGLVFKTSVPGKVIGARFYKSALNTGQHVANLWQMNGNMVGQAIFAGESASGWQEVLFGSGGFAIPVDTNHVISVNMPAGHYAGILNYFTADVISGPLTAPLSGSVPPGNGRFFENTVTPASPKFPNQSVSSANYWVDVMFQPT